MCEKNVESSSHVPIAAPLYRIIDFTVLFIFYSLQYCK
jgi:hypothetical protein